MTEFNDKDISNLFKEAKKEFLPDVNPFIKTRILAEVDSNGEKNGLKELLLRPWMMFLQGGLVALLVLFSINQFNKGHIEAMVGQAYAINIELEKINDESVAFVKVSLPDDVQFFSKSRNGKLAQRKALTIPMATLEAFEKLPIVIKSKDTGLKKIKLTLLDRSKNIIKEKQIKMKFSHSKELVF